MKTLFFVFSVQDCFKNFVALPHSLLERLAVPLQKGMFRLVFVVPEDRKKEFEKLEEYKNATPNVSIEYVYVRPRPKLTRFERVFVFFYSYLVYTGTTAVLATMGMRLNEPPGGSGRIFAPLKWLLSRTLGAMPWVRNSLVPFLFGFVFPERPFKKIFDTYRPDLIFIPNLHERYDQEASREAYLQQTARLGMALNWDHYDKYYLPFPPEHILVQSEQMQDFAHRFQKYQPSQMTLIGYPFLDFIQSGDYMQSRSEVLKDLGFPEESKYIMYIAGSMYCPDEPDVIEEMLRWADSGELGENIHFVIRPYPGGRGRDDAFDQQKFEGFAKHPRVSYQMQKFWAGMETNAAFMNIMRHADAVMAIYSTAVLPAAALDRPLLTLGFDGYKKRPLHRSVNRFAKREHFKDVIQSGGQAQPRSFAELKKILQTYLGHPETDADKRALLRTRVLGPFDGKSSERIFTAITDRLHL
ncbi:hypothetical protein A2841_00315 [Candidatus Kaiserbacteria bacterium RIFCSPHIGHO2_01_FULL_48_10]|uniref:Uncharacterized protein n=1 Tax=Candidatus Kaiserbacteria bacterium RIFCSPHIGHO2_01_FULL_48_10 TaxID=1798476 RepID=A0A1F6C193_9BACT|nr:MAG: hypothetical protein A2841_00315 [Candidatus Kaiserbacteria bacterium RIFCSPHIGHO2_01_FULL_48_10]